MQRLPAALLATLAAAALLAAFAAAARGDTVGCGSRSVGPGSLRRGGTAGAACLLRAFQQGCKAADYKLSLFGVDTVNTEGFRVALRRGRCGVDITMSFRVVPQQPHITGTRHCALVRRSGGDIVADRCSGGPPATVSLTSFS